MESEATAKKAGLGHNQPPSQAAFAIETAQTIGEWLKIHPVFQTEGEAKEYKLLRDRGKSCLADMEDERKARTRPHHKALDEINEDYKEPKVLLDRVLGEGDNRVDVWIRQEEEKRRKIKEEAWKKVQEAEEALRKAEERERAAKEEAAMGVETDVFTASRDAQNAADVLGRLGREAGRAEMYERVKVTGGHRRAISIRDTHDFEITDPALIVQQTGWTERLYGALESEVRIFYRKNGVWPKGVQIKSERKVQ